MGHPGGCFCNECIGSQELQSEFGRHAYAFLRWLKDMDIGVNLCHVHSREREELSHEEWEALIREWEESSDGPPESG